MRVSRMEKGMARFSSRPRRFTALYFRQSEYQEQRGVANVSTMNDKGRSQRTLSRKIRLDRDGNFDGESRENEGLAWETATLRNCLVSSPMSFCYTERPNS